MADRIVNRTWCVRSIGPFSIPLSICSEESTGPSRKRVSAVYPGLHAVEEELNVCIRQHQGGPSTTNGGVIDGGTCANIAWIDVEPTAAAEPIAQKSKRRRLSSHADRSDATGATASNGTTHLHIEVCIRDQPSAQILLCFPSCNNSSSSSTSSARSAFLRREQKMSGQCVIISSFSYLLVRGSRRAYQPVLLWLESTFGTVVAKTPFQPTSSQVARALALFTISTPPPANLNPHLPDTFLPASIQRSVVLHAGKPLEVSFAVPSHLAKAGLQKITLTVPPLALARFCDALALERVNSQKTNNMVQPFVDPIPPSKRARDDDDARTQRHDDDNNVSKSKDDGDREELPILRALECYMLETFRIDITSFPMVRAASGAVVFGCDGRCKPLDVSCLHLVFCEIRDMVQSRFLRIES